MKQKSYTTKSHSNIALANVLAFVFLIFGLNAGSSYGQCTNSATFGTATINTGGLVVTITTCAFAGEYSTINGAVSGQTLNFTSDVATDEITIHSGSPSGPVEASGTTPLSFANSITGTLYAHLNTPGCGIEANCRTTTVQCTNCILPPGPCTNSSAFGTANINAGGSVVTINTCSFAGEYATIGGAVSGQTLNFASSNPTDQITIHSGSPGGPVLAFGTTPQSFVNTFTGTLYAHWNTPGCVGQSTCRTTTVQCTSCTPANANDFCETAIPITCGQPITGNTSTATIESVGTCGITLNTAPGLWYTFAGNDSIVTLSLCGSSYDTKIGVFSGTCAALVCVTGNDDFCGLPSQVTFPTVNGTTYHIIVTGFSTASGAFTLAMTCVPNCIPTEISCPSNISVSNNPGQCGAVVNYPPATATGTTPDITYSIVSGSFFPIGATTVTATATNSCGFDTCLLIITVADNTPPEITCPATITVNNDSGVCGAKVCYPIPAITENCNPLTPAGYTLIGNYGNSYYYQSTSLTDYATAEADAITAGGHLAVITSAEEDSVIGNGGGAFAWLGGNDLATDGTFEWVNCEPFVYSAWCGGEPNGGTSENHLEYEGLNCFNDLEDLQLRYAILEIEGAKIFQIAGLPQNAFFPVGTTINTFVASDAAGNTDTCIFTVKVNDIFAPKITCGPTIFSCSHIVLLPSPIVTDNCSYTLANDAPGTYPIGNTTVTWTATDSSGNYSSCTQLVTVNPVPDVDQPANQTLCNNLTTALVSFTGSVPGTVFNWTNDNTSIGLAASGTSDISGFTAINTSNVPVTATITVTPSTGSAGGIDQNQPVIVGFISDLNTVTAQSFIPSSDFICGAGLNVLGLGDVTISLWTDLPTNAGVQLTSGTSNGGNGWVDVSWPSQAVAPGTTYYLLFTGSNPTLQFVNADIDTYPYGIPYYFNTYSPQPIFDCAFRTYSCGEPGCTGPSKTFTYTVNPDLLPSITCNLSFCEGKSTVLDAGAGYVSYLWSTSATTRKISATTANTFTVTVTDANGCTGSASVTTIVYPLPSVSFSGLASSYNVSASPALLNGSPSGGTFSGKGISGNKFYPNVAGIGGPYTITYTYANSHGCTKSVTKQTKVTGTCYTPSLPGTISGPASGVCKQTAVQYAVPYVSGVNFQWSFNTSYATIISGQGTNSITVKFLSSFSSGILSVKSSNGCGTSLAKTVNIIAVPSKPGSITGVSSVCKNKPNVPYSISSVYGATNYTWTGPTGSKIKDGLYISPGNSYTTSSTSIKVNFGTYAGNIQVKANNQCGSSSASTKYVSISCREEGEMIATNFDVHCYPNPASAEINVLFYSEEAVANTIRITDVLGKTLLQQINHSSIGENKYLLDVSILSGGIYMIEVLNGEQKRIQKIMIE